VLGAAFCYALGVVLVRILGRTDPTPAMVFWMLAIMGSIAALFAAPDWRPIAAAHWPLIAAVGVLGMLGQVAITEAFRQGEASVVAPFEYTALIYSVAMDAMIWGVLPDTWTWAGAGVIVASGLYLLRRERVHAQAEHP
jgi:drug/metabolite transporter (DMT)-like permease